MIKSMSFSLLFLALCFTSSTASISFSRTVEAIGSGDSFDLELEGSNGNNCGSSDEYGVNDCTFDWGENITGSFAGVLSAPLNDGSTLDVDLKVDKVVSWKFTCPVCGGNCTTEIPVVKTPVNVATPDCPIPSGSVELPIEIALPQDDPLGGVKVTATGTVGVKDENGDDVLKLGLDLSAQ